MPTAAQKVILENGDKLKAALEQLPGSLQRKVLKKALRAAAKPIVQETKATAPVHTGLLKRSFTVRSLKSRKRGSVGIKITTRGRAPHAHLVELGTQYRETKSGKSTGKVTGQHFMGRAAEAKAGQAVDIFQQQLAAAVIKEAKVGS